MPARTAKQITNKIKCSKLSLEYVPGEQYWLFVYNDKDANVFETKSVYVPYLNLMSMDRWVKSGKDFITNVEKLVEDRASDEPTFKLINGRLTAK